MLRGAIESATQSDERGAFVRRSSDGARARDLPDASPRFRRQRLRDLVADAEEAAPRPLLVRREPLLHLAV